MLARQFDEIVRAAAMDAIGLPPIETPGRRARRFMDRVDLVTAADRRARRHRRGRGRHAPSTSTCPACVWEGRDL